MLTHVLVQIMHKSLTRFTKLRAKKLGLVNHRPTLSVEMAGLERGQTSHLAPSEEKLPDAKVGRRRRCRVCGAPTGCLAPPDETRVVQGDCRKPLPSLDQAIERTHETAQ